MNARITDITTELIARLSALPALAGRVYRERVARIGDALPPRPFGVLIAVSDEMTGGTPARPVYSRAALLELVVDAGEADSPPGADPQAELQAAIAAAQTARDALLRDVRACLAGLIAPGGRVLGGLAQSLASGGCEIEEPDTGSTLAVLRVPIVIGYTEPGR
ncbi:hypothetical protein [Plasticicumulans acidivorans]|uniref:hypothetical protein n=1 Tax=Plasticicumulans acidivorans TaxID=886464 RepID=UPI0011B421C0|nr:hypothetical protein [Plasticicumulans acidivorans]